MQQRTKTLILIAIFLLGIFLRIGIAFHGHNFDVESYWIVGQIVDRGENVYAETVRYNYGPVWFTILGGLYRITAPFQDHFMAYRLSITLFLTVVDVLIALLLYKKFGRRVAALFFLNPVSIIITGYHSQFDNLAILLGLVAAILLMNEKDTKRTFAGWAMLGLSLMTKHILFAFPLWLAIRERGWRKVAAAIVPFGVFAGSFVPFWSEGGQGILDNVFLYRSMSNAPFWNTIAPGILTNNLPLFALFTVSLVLAGVLVRRQKVINSFLIYLGCLVLFSSSIANQYLAIVIPFVAVYFNIWLALWAVVASVFLIIEPGAGLGISQLAFIPLKAVSLNVQNALLFMGMVWITPLRDSIRKAVNWTKDEVKYQLHSFTKS